MTSLTVNLADDLKAAVQEKTKQDGVTLTFVVTQSLKAYKDGKLKFGLIGEAEEVQVDDETQMLMDEVVAGWNKE